MFEIDRGIKAPERPHDGRRKYPFREMLAGDSFLLPCDHDSKALSKARKRVWGAAKFAAS